MSKDPAFLFYTQDFLTGTMFMTDAEVGKYTRLLCAQHQHGGEINKRDFLNAIGEYTAVKEKFIESETGFYNERLFKEMGMRVKKSSSLSENARKRWGKHRENIQMQCKCNAIASGLHMPIEDEDAIEDRNAIEDSPIIEETTQQVNRGARVRNDGENSINPEFRQCSELLKKRILERKQQKITDATLSGWDNDVRLMVERDSRTVENIMLLINECHDMPKSPSGFTWADQIRSMSKLREHWNAGKIAVGMIACPKPTVVAYSNQSRYSTIDTKAQKGMIKNDSAS